MNSPYRIGLLAAVGAVIIGGSAFAASALGSSPPPQLPSQSPVTLQTRSQDDGSFTAPPPNQGAPGPSDTATPIPGAPLTPQPTESYTAPPPPVETYTGPAPWDDDDDDHDEEDDDGDDDD